MREALRPVIVAGNWKMHKTIAEAVQFVEALIPLIGDRERRVYLAIPYTAISATSQAAKGLITVGGENLYDAQEGAYTGEISSRMLVDAGARFVIIGHSERRTLFGEKNDFINRKIKRALEEGLQPMLCIGETEIERKNGNTENVLRDQLFSCLEGIEKEHITKLIIAYEPVWAIGTGQTATCEEAQKMHAFCRRLLHDKYGKNVSEKMPILYGGSVKPTNISGLMEQRDVDGVLVGGASLELESFSQIINYQTRLHVEDTR